MVETRKGKLLEPLAMVNKDVVFKPYLLDKVRPDAQQVLNAAIGLAKRYEDEDDIEDAAEKLVTEELTVIDKESAWDLQSLTAALSELEDSWDDVMKANPGKGMDKRIATALTSLIGYGMEVYLDHLKQAEVAGHVTTQLDRLGMMIAGRRIKKALK